MEVRQFALCFCVFVVVKCGYPPIGDEVQPGSVLLPATRRGRYLANIVRRQAVDGTGIKFNKDADRMNAEAKKKVDVLSEELLPYIIAEQERRTTLYKRVMTAIQNGEKGVTIAEIRNKPPLIIRKGLMFRCPANRVPKEPDGSGIIMCEDEIEPTPIMYDSCLSAEDKDLYVAENKYFFCNRHKVEGPDLPRNGSVVIGCAPTERTSLNYTSMKCALEDTDDVVVHYRYYPDRTYKFVTELDPDREVCDHWNPCQIGYIYSLPSPDQALPANELWHDYVVDTIAEDSKSEYAHPLKQYESSDRRVRIPDGFKFDSVWRHADPYTNKVDPSHKVKQNQLKIKGHSFAKDTRRSSHGKYITISINFGKFYESNYGPYYAVFMPEDGSGKEKSVKFMVIEKASINLELKKVTMMPQAAMDPALIEYKCQRCRVQGIVVRGDDGQMYNLDNSRFKIIQSMGDGKKAVQIQLNNAKAKDFGTYMFTFLNDEGREEIIQALQLHAPEKVLNAPVLRVSAAIGEHVDKTITYSCEGCELTDITCNGDSVTSGGRVSIVPGVKMISFNFPSFEDVNACVYMGVFKKDNSSYRKVLAVIETITVVEITSPSSPPYGEPFEFGTKITCEDVCEIEKMTVNGIELDSAPTRRSNGGPMAYYVASPSTINVHIAEFSEMYEGVYMAIFKLGHENDMITKTVAEIKDSNAKDDRPDNGDGAATGDAASGAETKPAEDKPADVPGDSKPEGTPGEDATPAGEGEGETTAATAAETEETPAEERRRLGTNQLTTEAPVTQPTTIVVTTPTTTMTSTTEKKPAS